MGDSIKEKKRSPDRIDKYRLIRVRVYIYIGTLAAIVTINLKIQEARSETKWRPNRRSWALEPYYLLWVFVGSKGLKASFSKWKEKKRKKNDNRSSMIVDQAVASSHPNDSAFHSLLDLRSDRYSCKSSSLMTRVTIPTDLSLPSSTFASGKPNFF